MMTDGNDRPINMSNIVDIAESANNQDTLIGGAFQHLWERLSEQIDEHNTFRRIEGSKYDRDVTYLVKISESGDKKTITFRAIRDYVPTQTEKKDGERKIHDVAFSQYGENDDTITREDLPSGEVTTDVPHTSRIPNLPDFLSQLRNIKYK